MNKCNDCNKEIRDGVLLGYETTLFDKKKTIEVYKCNECYEKDESLRNYQQCEVYSRISGYLRPTQNWNEGKLQEFKDRKTFTA